MILLFLFLLISPCYTISLEELLPQNWRTPWERTYYHKGDPVDLLVNSVDSEDTQLPYAYYRLPFVCPPRPETRPVQLSLGEILNGDRLWMSDYQLRFGVDEPCVRLCDRITKPEGVKRAAELIRKDYMVNWWIDGLPGATTLIKPQTSQEPAKKYYVAGFPLGFVQNDISYLHNHVMLVIRWHSEDYTGGKKSIVGFEVYPKSVSDAHCPGASRDFSNLAMDPESKGKHVIPFTYSIYWREDPTVEYDDRYSLYITPGSDAAGAGRMHWFAVINSLVLVSFLSLIAAVVLLKTLNSDLHQHQHNWEAVADEVFIQPVKMTWLCVLAGTGIQLFFTIAGVCVLLSTRISPPTESILSLAMTLFVVAGFFAGFSSVQFYHRFAATYNTSQSLWIAFLSGSLLSALCLIVQAVCSLLTYEQHSSRALQVSTVLALVGIYVLIQVPISLIGGYLSCKVNLFSLIMKGRILPPSELSTRSRRPIPQQPWYNRLRYSLPLSGAFPFGIIFVEMIYLYKSLWEDKTSLNAMYGFVSFTTLLLCVVVAEISIITTYLHLNAGDYQDWQWKSFTTCSGSIFLYLVLYTLRYLARMRMVDAVSPLLYLTYSMMLNVIISVACGALGLVSSTLFVYTIYTSIKTD
ncbi:DEKNAAC104057 [Brettanomyces naardenensis]|uniref:Transmembrane 9 superfamily member n=1 Tax=Brettanomyces naardenensis TaxID=13370 RepID=A0A448YQ54_BRENA|nr:DEKNAAC104057 [Brettanomyces naardenensis]